MRVYFATRIDRVVDDIEIFRSLIRTLYSLGHNLISDWVELEYQRAVNSARGIERDWDRIYQDIRDAAERCDVIIAEASGYGSFGVGLITGLGLQKKKPILILDKERPEGGAIPEGMKIDPLVTYRQYEGNKIEEMCDIVKEFLDINAAEAKDLRVNFAIDRKIHNHLRWQAYKMNKTKAEIVRDLIVEDMRSSDL